MNRVKEMHPDCYYLFEGKSSANTMFVENIKEAKQFCIYANAFLKGYLKIHEYLITEDGWMMLVKLNSKQTLSKLSKDESEYWRIISERMRLFLSTYVRVTNKWEGREGVKVKHSYRRYYFETLKEAKLCISNMRNQQYKLYQKKKKYRGLKTHRAIPTKLGKGSIFLCSKWVKKWRKGKSKRASFNSVWADIIEFKDLVVQNAIDSTFKSHNSSPSYQKME